MSSRCILGLLEVSHNRNVRVRKEFIMENLLITECRHHRHHPPSRNVRVRNEFIMENLLITECRHHGHHPPSA